MVYAILTKVGEWTYRITVLFLSQRSMTQDFAIIDANISRASEGLRVLEDSARFVLRDGEYFGKLKEIRHKVRDLGRDYGWANLLSLRHGVDVGKEPIVENEYARTSLYSIIMANSHRVTQALRVLEEFAKVYSNSDAYTIEDLRYEMYALEYRLAAETPHFWLEKYFTNGIVYPISDSVTDIVWLIDRGAKVVQLRDKNSTKGEVYQKAEYICEYIAQKTPIDGPVLFILNDYPEIGAELSVAGVHIGQDDENLKKVRRLLGTNKIIGRSNQSIDEMEDSIKSGSDYVSIGPVFATPTKSERQPVGIESVVSAAKQIKSPWVAIGGIDADSAPILREAGAKNIAVVRAARDFFA